MMASACSLPMPGTATGGPHTAANPWPGLGLLDKWAQWLAELRIDVDLSGRDIQREFDALHERIRTNHRTRDAMQPLPLHLHGLVLRMREADGEVFVYAIDPLRNRIVAYTVFNRLVEVDRHTDRHLRAAHQGGTRLPPHGHCHRHLPLVAGLGPQPHDRCTAIGRRPWPVDVLGARLHAGSGAHCRAQTCAAVAAATSTRIFRRTGHEAGAGGARLPLGGFRPALHPKRLRGLSASPAFNPANSYCRLPRCSISTAIRVAKGCPAAAQGKT
jgi:hypothetical protein